VFVDDAAERNVSSLGATVSSGRGRVFDRRLRRHVECEMGVRTPNASTRVPSNRERQHTPRRCRVEPYEISLLRTSVPGHARSSFCDSRTRSSYATSSGSGCRSASTNAHSVEGVESSSRLFRKYSSATASATCEAALELLRETAHAVGDTSDLAVLEVARCGEQSFGPRELLPIATPEHAEALSAATEAERTLRGRAREKEESSTSAGHRARYSARRLGSGRRLERGRASDGSRAVLRRVANVRAGDTSSPLARASSHLEERQPSSRASSRRDATSIWHCA